MIMMIVKVTTSFVRWSYNDDDNDINDDKNIYDNVDDYDDMSLMSLGDHIRCLTGLMVGRDSGS